MRIQREKSLLLMVDFQGGLLPVIEGGFQAVEEASWLGELANFLEIPVWLTEQNPEKLGGSATSLLERLGEYQVWQKAHFSVMEEADFHQALAVSGKTQIVLCGTEAHICVMQTALGLLDESYDVFWLTEATASRRRSEAKLARQRACANGAEAVTADMVAYEWLYRCDTAEFKQAHQQFLKLRSARPVQFN